MEANGILGRGLAGGVRINSAWCELNEQQVAGIPINVRSRLLDFVLDLRDAIGPGADDREISEKSKSLDTQSMFGRAIFGDHATIIYGSGSAQITVNVQAGDLPSLEQELARSGLPPQEIEGLRKAISDDQANGRASMDGEVGNWFTGLLGKAVKGVAGVGVDVVSSTVAKALTTYLGAG